IRTMSGGGSSVVFDGGGSGPSVTDWDNIQNNPFSNSDPSDFASAGHNHDGRYLNISGSGGNITNVDGDANNLNTVFTYFNKVSQNIPNTQNGGYLLTGSISADFDWQGYLGSNQDSFYFRSKAGGDWTGKPWYHVASREWVGSNYYTKGQADSTFGDKFNSSGNYANLRARATTKGDVGLANVRNVASYSQTEANSRFLNEDNNLSDLDNTTTAQTNLKLKDGTADLDFHSLAISSNEEGLLVGQNVPVRIATARDASRGSVTVQPTATAPGSVELFPGGTSERSHFLATNATDEDNFGFVELEVNKKDSWIAPGVKGAGDIPVNFRVWGFQKGISLQDNVSIGVNIDSPDPLTVQGGFPQVRLVRDANTDQGLTLQGGAGNAIYDSYNVGGNTFPQHTFRTTNDTTSEDILNLDYSNGSTFYTGLTVGGITTFKDDIETDHFSDWFSANPTGFQVSYDGTGDFRTVLTDEL